MQTFTDSHGREWLVRLTVGKIATVYERLGLSIYMLVEGDQTELAELLDNYPLLANVVYLLCRGQARQMRVTPAEFARSIAEIEGMQQAFVRALVRFFPPPDPKQKKKPEGGAPRTHDSWERTILEAAGVAGLDPLKHSLRTIHHVAMGRQSESWWHTAHLLAQTANLHRDKKKRPTPYTPAEVNPFVAATTAATKEKKDGTALITSMAPGMLSPDKSDRFALIIAAKHYAKETGDWTEFNRLAKGE